MWYRYPCSICKKTFASPLIMRRHHVAVHTSERPFVCPICSVAFKRKNHVDKHQRVHTGERPHPCHICPRRFGSKHNLQSHLNRHKSQRKRDLTLAPTVL